MKGSAVISLHIVAVCVFALTQGCETTKSSGSGRGAGARRSGPWKHQHKGNKPTSQEGTAVAVFQDDFNSDYDPMSNDSVIIETDTSDDFISAAYVAPVAPVASQTTYIVQKGDILSQLATDFDTTTKTLVSLNNLSNPDVLFVGQEIVVPGGSGGSQVTTHTSKTTRSPIKKGGEYTIQKGDTLSGIAVAAGVSINDLRSLNDIKDNQIFAGETLYIPSGGKVPSKKASTKKKSVAPIVVSPVVKKAPAPLEPVAPMLDDSANASVGLVIDHLVYPNETLDDISRQFGVSKKDIMQLNNITDENSIYENQRLRIPISE